MVEMIAPAARSEREAGRFESATRWPRPSEPRPYGTLLPDHPGSVEDDRGAAAVDGVHIGAHGRQFILGREAAAIVALSQPGGTPC
jgi:hypothetical protein